MSKAIDDIAAERLRQVEAEGWSPDHDDKHTNCELATAAACYAIGSPLLMLPGQDGKPLYIWPWDLEWWKSTDPRRDLVKAGALIVAEIERLDRAANLGGQADG